MNRLIAGAITAAGSLAIAGGFVATAASSSAASGARSAAQHPAVVQHVAKAKDGNAGDNSSYGSSAPAGPITAPPQGLASSSGPNSVIVSNVNISGLLTTGTTLDTASTVTAFSKVSSVHASVSGGGHSVSLTGSQFSSTCRSDTASGSANVIDGVLASDGIPFVHLPDHPTINQTFPLSVSGAGGTLTLNHQIPAPGGGVEVIAADLHFTGTTPAQDLLIGVSVCTSPGTLGNTVTVTNPGDQTSNSGTPITPLPIVATDSDPGQTLTYSATGLPPGLTINPTTGVISGTPTTATGSPFTVTVTATDTTGASGSTTFTWTINNVVTVTNPGPQTATVGTPFTLAMSATDSDTSITTFTWAATGLPPGLTINPATGVISGTPTTATGSPFMVHVTATDSTGASGSADFTITVTSPNLVTVTPSVVTVTATEGVAITPVTMTTTDTGVVTPFTPFTFTIASGTLPAGVTLDATTGTISGTPAAGSSAGSPYTVTVRATDVTGATAVTGTITINVTAP